MDVSVIRENPFEESSGDLVTLNNKACVAKSAATSVRRLESMGQEQYDNFRKDVLELNHVLLTVPIKRNNFFLFHDPKTWKKTEIKR